MRNKVTLDMMDPCGCDCKCIISESDGSNTLELYMWSVGTNPAVFFQWTDPDGTGHAQGDMSGFFLDSGEYYYSANPEIFAENRLITMTVSWNGFTSREIYFQCVNLTADTNFTVTRDLSSDDLYRVAAATDDTLPIATTTTTGVVQIGTGLNVDESGIISTPIASREALGIVKIGDGIDVDEGTISLAAATEETIGGVKPGERMTFYTNGTIDVPLATTEIPGVVQVGSGIIVDENGVISTSGSIGILTEYEYLTDLSVKFNGTTYTVEKDDTTGLISKISDGAGNTFEPTINSGITDVALHNAVFWAVAMCRGLVLPTRIMLYDNGNEYPEITGGWELNVVTGGTYFAECVTSSKSDGVLYGRLTATNSVPTNKKMGNVSFTTANQISLAGYTKVCAEGEWFIELANSGNRNCDLILTLFANKPIPDTPASPVSAKYRRRTDDSEFGVARNVTYEFDVSDLDYAHYISVNIWGTTWLGDTTVASTNAYFKVSKIWLEK